MKAPSLYVQTIPTSWGDNPIRFGAMGPWSQPYSMDLVRVGEFVLAYLPNPASYGHETYTIGYSKDWRLKRCVEILWQPHQIWSYGPVKSAIFHGFGSCGWICAGISPEPYKLWTWDLHHWIQQRLTFKRMCRNTVTTPSDLELWTREISYVSWIWFGLVDLWYHISWTLYQLWTGDLYHWIQQRLRFKRFCRNIVINPSGLELWAPDFNHVS